METKGTTSKTANETCRGWITRGGRYERCYHPTWIALATDDQCYFCRAAEASATRAVTAQRQS